MKRRPRKMLKLLLFLLAGAIINVAVAWGFALLSTTANSGLLCEREYATPGHPDRQVLLVYPGRGTTCVAEVNIVRSIIQKQRVAIVPLDVASLRWSKIISGYVNPYCALEEASGWPVRSMVWHYEAMSPSAAGQISGGIELGSRRRALGYGIDIGSNRVQPWGPTDVPARVLPLRPIWPGFAINTIFYAAVLWGGWVLFAVPFKVRRWRRIKRGQCASCGYSLRGTLHIDTCPECGATA